MMRESLLQNLSLWGCLWQSMALIALGLVAGYLLRRRPSRAYQVLLFAMMAAAIVPLMSAVVRHFDLGVFTARASDSLGTPLEGPEVIPLAGTDDLAGIAIPDAVSPAGINSGPAEIAFARHSISWRAVTVYGWMIATLALLARLIVTFMYGAYIVRNAQRSGCEQVQQAVDDATLNLGLSCGLQVRGSKRTRSPIVWCWSRPPILLVPNSCGDPKIDWAGVVAHELAHCKRWDHITGLMAELMVCLLPWNPLMWLSKKCLVRFGEQACDDWVVATGKPSEDYAESLLRFRPQRQMAFLPAIVHSKKGLAGRVDRILKDSCGNPRTGAKWALATSLATLCLTVGVALAQTRPAEPASTEAQEKPPAKSLHEAAEAGDVAEVKRLIAEGADVNVTDEKNKTPLCAAAYNKGHAEVIRVLLANGAKVDMGDSYGYTPLFYAIWSDDEEAVKALISGGADVNKRPPNEKYYHPLVYAIWQDQPGIVRVLLDAGAKAEQEDFRGWSPLQNALSSIGNPDIVTLLANTDDKVPDLHRAALRGDLPGLKELLGKGADLNEKDGFGQTPLYYALAAGQGDAAKFLIHQGADINLKTRVGRTLLHQASRAGLLEMVQILLARDMPVDAVSVPGQTPLHEAASAGHKEIVELLISKGASVDSKDRGNRTPLYMAAGSGKADMVELLIDKGADINASSTQGRTPLDAAKQQKHMEVVNILRQHGAKEDSSAGEDDAEPTKSLIQAVTFNNIDEVKRLISSGADVNAKDEHGQTLLISGLNNAVLSKEVAELLIEQGADVNAQDDKGWTALLRAIICVNKDIVSLLVSKGADVNLTPEEDDTPLHYAVWSEDLDIVKLLVDKGAKFDVKTRDGYTAFRYAALYGRRDMVELFIGKGADTSGFHMAAFTGDLERVRDFVEKGTKIDTKDDVGWTALFWAACGGQEEVAEFLIDNNADLSANDGEGQTLLHQAAQADAIKLVELLIAKGADVNAKNARGGIPLHLACYAGNKDIAELLIAKGSDVNAKNNPGRTPLHNAASGGHIEVAELLISQGADVNADNAENNIRLSYNPTPLHMAVMREKTDMVKFLIDKGADINASSGFFGRTPLQQAVMTRKIHNVELLIDKGADINASTRVPPPLALAVLQGDTEIVELLITKGADVNALNHAGVTPLDRAEVKRGNPEIVELLKKHGAKE